MANYNNGQSNLSLTEMVKMLWDSYIGGTIPEGYVVVDEESEEERESAETQRKANEVSRGLAETARAEAESARVTAESLRVSAETARTTAETARKATFENEMETLDDLRDKVLTGVATLVYNPEYEAQRVSAEKVRATSEEERIKNEEERIANEIKRGVAETTRQTDEKTREQFESIRKSNEVERIELYDKMKDLFDKYRFGKGDSSLISDIYGEHTKGNNYMTIYFVFASERVISFQIPYVDMDSVSSFVKYAKSDSGSIKPAESEYTETIPDVEQGKYLWTWTRISFSDGTYIDTYSVSRVGIDGKGIVKSVIDYSQQQTPVDPATITDWGDYPATLIENYWLYVRTKIYYSDGVITTSYSASKNGTGSFYAGVEEYYAPCDNGSTAPSGYPNAGKYIEGETIVIGGDWKEERPSESVLYTKPYIWNFEISYDSAGNKYVTTPICIGNFSRGIASIVELYAISKYYKADVESALYPSDITAWTDEQQDAAPTADKPYQWNKTVTTYNDSSYEVHYHVSAVRGDDSFNVNITTSTGTLILKGDATNTLTATVTQGGNDITSSLDKAQFSWVRVSEDTAGDAIWNAKHAGVGNSITIGNSDVTRKAMFECDVDI